MNGGAVRLAIVSILGVLITVLIVMAVWLWWQVSAAQLAADERAKALNAAGAHAVNLLSVSHKTIDEDIKRALSSATGRAKAEFARDSEVLKKTTVDDKILQTAVLRATGLITTDGSTARVLVVADSLVRWEDSEAAPAKRFYRWNMQVTKVGRSWLVSEAERVP
ncbi:hypothetical protein [Sinosporangium siamense]|uniref:Mce-associated membrane protein n=1 Tax=Sinosporangium siamense TaxID=1367973 RepID=A0A919RJY6_9ACTN|nr:hypothetical protein [Sinosporangium siamense]GII93294.1 hypothetical protein Ssi02_35250 [Sinosporangium siamense]